MFWRLGEPFWLQSLQKSEDGPSMSVEGSITVLQEKVVDFVLMQIFLFAYTMPLSGWIFLGMDCWSSYVIDAALAFIVYSVRMSILNCYLQAWDLILIICKIVQGDDNWSWCTSRKWPWNGFFQWQYDFLSLLMVCCFFRNFAYIFCANRTRLYSGYVQPWDISICKSPFMEIALHSLGAKFSSYSFE